jgi:hypothetical protein
VDGNSAVAVAPAYRVFRKTSYLDPQMRDRKQPRV